MTTNLIEQARKDADEVVRYCPECGTIGPLPDARQACCPDSFGMSIRRWQAEKMERKLEELRAALASADGGHGVQVPQPGRGKELHDKLMRAIQTLIRARDEPSKWGSVGADAEDIAWDKVRELVNYICVGIDSPPAAAPEAPAQAPTPAAEPAGEPVALDKGRLLARLRIILGQINQLEWKTGLGGSYFETVQEQCEAIVKDLGLEKLPKHVMTLPASWVERRLDGGFNIIEPRGKYVRSPSHQSPAQASDAEDAGVIVSAYRIGDGLDAIRVERTQQLSGDDLWAVRLHGRCTVELLDSPQSSELESPLYLHPAPQSDEARDAWISVHDRLPELPIDNEDDGTKVYTWDGEFVTEDVFQPTYEQPAGPAVGGWLRTDDWFCSDLAGRVTHWMPRELPAPPAAMKESGHE